MSEQAIRYTDSPCKKPEQRVGEQKLTEMGANRDTSPKGKTAVVCDFRGLC